MKKFIKLLTLSFASVLVLASCNSNATSSINPTSTIPNTSTPTLDKSKNLVVYAVNDTHGKIEEDPGSSIAGLAKIRDYIYQDKDYDPDYSVIVSAGDMFQGAGLSNLTLGRAMTEVMNAFPFDAMTVGNHEFDWGLTELLDNIKDLKTYEILGCNILEKSTSKLPDNISPSVLVQKGGYKVGIVGSIQSGIDSSIAYNKVKDYDIVPDADLAIAEAKKLKDAGADYVIYSGHQGLTSAVEDVADSGYIDLAILGHTHATINNTRKVGTKTIPLLEANCDAKSFSKTIFNEDGYVSHEIHAFNRSQIEGITLSKTMSDIIDKYNKEAEPILNEEIVQVDGRLSRYSNEGGGKIGTLITKTLYEYGIDCGLTNVIGVHNTGGVRASFVSDSYPAMMTYGDLYTISPFDNEVKYVTVKGQNVEHAITSHYFYPSIAELNIKPEEDYNIVTIDYLTTTPGYPLYAENGGSYPGGENYFIRDLLKLRWSQLDIIHIADYPF